MVQLKGVNGLDATGAPASAEDSEETGLWGTVKVDTEETPAGASKPRFKFFSQSGFMQKLKSLLVKAQNGEEGYNGGFQAHHHSHVNANILEGFDFESGIQAHINTRQGTEDPEYSEE